MNYQDLWNQTLDTLKKDLSESSFNDTFNETNKVLKEENGTIYVLAPSTYIKHKINNMYLQKISDILANLTDKNLRFKFICEDEIKSETPLTPAIKFRKNNLNPNYTFESMVVGESNRLAYITATKVAEHPGIFVNPLYIFGGVGLGKTHLMQAVGNYILEKDLNTKILYIQASEFVMDYSKASKEHNFTAFDEKYDDLDVLLVDDIQMLEIGKISQQQFFKLFNDMFTKQKQIIITSDCPAPKLSGIMDRLTSRFQMGVTVDITQPDLNQRVNILKRKAKEATDKILSDEVLFYIADNFKDNVRELEGGLNRVLWVSEVYNTTPTLALAKEALEVLINAKKNEPNKNYENVLSVTASTYNISVTDIIGSSRSSKYVLPRHIVMYILYSNFDLKYSRIGVILNNRDHTTVMNGVKKIEEELKTNQELKNVIDNIMKKV